MIFEQEDEKDDSFDGHFVSLTSKKHQLKLFGFTNGFVRFERFGKVFESQMWSCQIIILICLEKS